MHLIMHAFFLQGEILILTPEDIMKYRQLYQACYL